MKYEEFPSEPQIRLLDFGLIYSSNPGDGMGATTLDTTALDAIFQFEFTDGDGNFGTDNSTEKNVFIHYYKMLNGELVPVTKEILGELDTIEYSGRIGLLPVSEEQGYLKGTIWDTIPKFYDFLSDDFDTISFDLYIVDRDGNKSNTESTGIRTIRRGN